MAVKNAVVRYIAQKVAKLIQEIGFTPEKIAKLTEDIIKILRGEAGRGHHQDSERMAVGALLCTNGSLSYVHWPSSYS